MLAVSETITVYKEEMHFVYLCNPGQNHACQMQHWNTCKNSSFCLWRSGQEVYHSAIIMPRLQIHKYHSILHKEDRIHVPVLYIAWSHSLGKPAPSWDRKATHLIMPIFHLTDRCSPVASWDSEQWSTDVYVILLALVWSGIIHGIPIFTSLLRFC